MSFNIHKYHYPSANLRYNLNIAEKMIDFQFIQEQ